MGKNISAIISPQGAARLLLCNEIDLTDSWSFSQSQSVLDALLSMSIEELLSIVDSTEPAYFDTANIPQFGSIESLIRVPSILIEAGCGKMNYAELGLRLKNDVTAKLDANIKFGENHGKGAALLGLVNCIDKRFSLSSLSNGFNQISDSAKQREIVLRLFFRIPLVQAILKSAKEGITNGYDYMIDLTESTKKRRGQCLRAIFRDLKELYNQDLDMRLINIIWTC